jgi:glutathione S-transferase
MKLYTYDPAPNPQRLALFLKYKGIELETHQIDMMQAEQLSEEYRAINPACTVPALVLDDGTVMTEVIGICHYLESLHPEKPLMGTTALEKAQVISWCHKLFLTAFMAIADILRNTSPGMANRGLPGPLNLPQIPALAERGKMRLEHAWETLEEAVPGEGWLAGDHFSQADIDLHVCAGFSGWVKSKPPESCSNLHAYLGRVAAELG